MITGKSYHVTVEDFDAWFLRAQRGDVLTYCSGYLARDRSELGVATVLDKVAARAWFAFTNGYGFLFQRRHGELRYDYVIMIGRPALGGLAGPTGAPARAPHFNPELV